MIRLLDILKENFEPSFPYNSLITPEVWSEFIEELTRTYKANKGKVEYYNPAKVAKLSPEKLNSGYCHTLAYAINAVDSSYKPVDTDEYRAELKKAGIKNASDHGFVVKGDKFYDAEAPNGVETPAELPYFKRLLQKKQAKTKLP